MATQAVLDAAGATVGVAREATRPLLCFHCGTRCPDDTIRDEAHCFCCRGCLTVYRLLGASGLGRFYDLEQTPGIRMPASTPAPAALAHLDAPDVRQRLLDFSDGRLARVSFRIPAMHCAACVWLLENLFRLDPAIGESRVHFPRKELCLSFDETRTRLSAVVALLTSLGYAPDLNLDRLDAPARRADPAARALLMRIGVAGFAFGNIMLLSFPSYLGLNPAREASLQRFFGMMSILLALPVLVYSASGYWSAAWRCLRGRMLTIEFPIAVGILALFGQSVVEILTGTSEGYLDSFSGLIFLLLCGQWFQRHTFAGFSFERDYKAYFPLAALRREGDGSTRAVPVTALAVGDRILVRNAELIPADARLLAGDACIDYSFVTGEAAPVTHAVGEHVYAGGRQAGGLIELETVKAVSQSYLTSLWNSAVFSKPREAAIQTLTNRAGRWFTYGVIAIALATASVWLVIAPGQALRPFTAILLVACPCALALTAPFALGSAQRLLGRMHFFLRNSSVVEDLARIDTIVFDKTGTLTPAGGPALTFAGAPLREDERAWVAALAAQSAHPASRAVAAALQADDTGTAATQRGPTGEALVLLAAPVTDVRELPGQGISGTVAGHALRLGSASFVGGGANADSAHCRPSAATGNRRAGAAPPSPAPWEASAGAGHRAAWPVGAGPGTTADTDVLTPASPVGEVTDERQDAHSAPGPHLSIDGAWRGRFAREHAYRPGLESMIHSLASQFRLALLSGDTPHEEPALSPIFGTAAMLRFQQSPHDKLAYIRSEQEKGGHAVLMVGDGLNDAGALRQSQVGIAVTESVGLFSPASDAILDGQQLPRLAAFLAFARDTVAVVKIGFAISLAYNAVGIGYAATGRLSPLVAAVLMPISSFSVIGFALLATRAAAWRRGLRA